LAMNAVAPLQFRLTLLRSGVPLRSPDESDQVS
jgi:hypothetical protein